MMPPSANSGKAGQKRIVRIIATWPSARSTTSACAAGPKCVTRSAPPASAETHISEVASTATTATQNTRSPGFERLDMGYLGPAIRVGVFAHERAHHDADPGRDQQQRPGVAISHPVPAERAGEEHRADERERDARDHA